MTPHSNRSKTKAVAGREPRPEELRKYRQAAGLTQEQAAEVIYTSPRNWQNWEQGHGDRRMPASAFELFMLKTGQYAVIEHFDLVPAWRDGRMGMYRTRLDNGAIIELRSPKA